MTMSRDKRPAGVAAVGGLAGRTGDGGVAGRTVGDAGRPGKGRGRR